MQHINHIGAFHWSRWNSGHSGVRWHRVDMKEATVTLCSKPIPSHALGFYGIVREGDVCGNCRRIIEREIAREVGAR